MLMPSIFRENLLDDFWGYPYRVHGYDSGANEVVIYNFLALLTIDTNINQFIKSYHIPNKY